MSALIQPAMAFAQEPGPVAYEAEYPALETVRPELAEDEIVTPSGVVAFKSGQLAAENLETGADGAVTVKNLHLETYRVTEVQAPKGFYNFRGFTIGFKTKKVLAD